ncbi:hypothetical protein [Nocardiopsis alba]|uniref:hypothetical protein n=1 Tax=Nocardiopsis alba TaxID=53437 RepID=UPI0033E535F1
MTDDVHDPEEPTPEAAHTLRKRGRPSRPSAGEGHEQESRGRGRPRNTEAHEGYPSEEEGEDASASTEKKRGRPPKATLDD